MYAYDDQYNEEYPEENVKREKKKKKHRKHRSEDDQEDNVNQPAVDGYRQSEEENFDPHNFQRDHKYNPERNDFDENNGEVMFGEDDEQHKRHKKHKKKKKQQEQYNEDFPDHDDLNYPFEGGEAYGYRDPGLPDEEAFPEDRHADYSDEQESEVRNESPPQPEPQVKKKSGGFGKIFASFKKKSNKEKKMKQGEWESNPNIFNPAYDENSSKASSKKAVRNIPGAVASVILLDGEETNFNIDNKYTGQQLFDVVCDYLDLKEKDFFGLTFVAQKLRTWFWLDMTKKINKQLEKGDDWQFNFQVKFYPPEPVLLQEDITRYLLCLQVRQDVFTGKLPCSWITQALLGSFLVQSELGDYDPEDHGDDIKYLEQFEFVGGQSDQLLQKIAELHQKHAGMSSDKADVKYLETAKRLELYGVDLHPVRDNDDFEISLGVCYQGVLIYRGRDRIGRFAWPKVLRISYKKNYFYLKIRSDRHENSEAIVGFKLLNHQMAKRLWKNAVEQHTFFRMKDTQMGGRSTGKTMTRLFASGSGTLANSRNPYSGKTLHQYRSMNINRNQPARFDRSLAKRQTIGSMPAGLDRTGAQYGSMHSLNRVHPRDMTLGKTKSVEYLSFKKPASSLGFKAHDRESSFDQRSSGVPAPRQQPFGSISSYREESQHSFRSGDSINVEDSYTVRQDDRVSLPPLPSSALPVETGYDGNRFVGMQQPNKPVASARKKPRKLSVDTLSDEEPREQVFYKPNPNIRNQQPKMMVPTITTKTSAAPSTVISPKKKQSISSDDENEEEDSRQYSVPVSNIKVSKKHQEPHMVVGSNRTEQIRYNQVPQQQQQQQPVMVMPTEIPSKMLKPTKKKQQQQQYVPEDVTVQNRYQHQYQQQPQHHHEPPPPLTPPSSGGSSPTPQALPPPPPHLDDPSLSASSPRHTENVVITTTYYRTDSRNNTHTGERMKPPPVKPKPPAVKPKPKVNMKFEVKKEVMRDYEESSNDDML